MEQQNISESGYTPPDSHKLRIRRYQERIRRNLKTMRVLKNVAENSGNDLVKKIKGHSGKEIIYFNSPPNMDGILNSSGTMMPIPLVLAFMPTAYFRVFSRIVMVTMDTTFLCSHKDPFRISLTAFYNSLSKIDQCRFYEIISFFLKLRILNLEKPYGTDEYLLGLAPPYCNFYCGMSVSAVSTLVKTHCMQFKDHISNTHYKWHDFKKIRPIIPDTFEYKDLSDE